MSHLKASVRSHQGVPTLFINDRPDSGLMLYHNNVSVGAEEIADFGKAGIHLLTAPVAGASMVREDGSIDTTQIDLRMKQVLDANPRALVMPRLGVFPPKWWSERYPEERMIHHDPHLQNEVFSEYRLTSFASERWRTDMGHAMRQVIRYCEQTYGEHMLGYHINGGECGEWSYAWRNYTQSDHSIPQRDAFRRWLKNDSAEIPRDWRRHEGEDGTFDPQRDATLIRYMEFHSEMVASAILHFSRLAREELRSLRSEKVIAIFYAYHFTPPGNPSAFFNSGHHAVAKILESDDIDILCAPYSYEGREAGGGYYSQLVAGSAALHGKLVYSEEDTVTHVVAPVPYRYCCPDRWTTVQVLRRNMLGALRDGGTQWFMDWFGKNWYRDAELMQQITEMRMLADDLVKRDRTSVAEVAVLASPRTVSRWKHDPQLINDYSLDRMRELVKLGAPIDTYFIDDLPAVGQRYKMLVLLDVPGETLPVGPHVVASDGRPFDLPKLRARARELGVHLYTETDDQILAGVDWIAVHASSDGTRNLRSRDGKTLHRTVRKGETLFWDLRA